MATNELLIVITLLKEASTKFNDLYKEAVIDLEGRHDTAGYRKKLDARAQLLIDLEASTAIPISTLKGVEKDLGFEIRTKIAIFARQAKEALSSAGTFTLSVLLTHRGDEAGAKNDLEKLIEYLESK